jgi:hypothetical protein
MHKTVQVFERDRFLLHKEGSSFKNLQHAFFVIYGDKQQCQEG